MKTPSESKIITSASLGPAPVSGVLPAERIPKITTEARQTLSARKAGGKKRGKR